MSHKVQEASAWFCLLEWEQVQKGNSTALCARRSPVSLEYSLFVALVKLDKYFPHRNAQKLRERLIWSLLLLLLQYCWEQHTVSTRVLCMGTIINDPYYSICSLILYKHLNYIRVKSGLSWSLLQWNLAVLSQTFLRTHLLLIFEFYMLSQILLGSMAWQSLGVRLCPSYVDPNTKAGIRAPDALPTVMVYVMQ